jgi:branched-chain amino acid transport system substrate-binding protein
VRLLHGRGPRLSACLGALALVLSGCSSTSTPSKSAVTVTGSTLHVLAAQPPGAADSVSSDVLDAEKLALKQAPGGKVGTFTVQLRIVHGNEVSASARAAVKDKQAIAYLGEIAPGTSGVSLQITNQVGLLQLSPSDTAIYLTQATPAVSDSPNHYYPANGTYHHTFARVVPNSAAEAKALVRDMQALHVSKLFVSSDGTTYGASVTDEVRQDARAAGLVLSSAAADANGVFYAAVNGPRAKQALDQMAASAPAAKLFLPSALYDDTLVAGLSAAAQRNLYVSSPGVGAAAQSAAAKAFTSDFQSTYGHAPQPQAIYGYETMSALLAVLKSLGANANSRAQVVARFRGLKDPPQSALGPYSLTNGDTNLGASSFVIAHPAGGRLVPRNQP